MKKLPSFSTVLSRQFAELRGEMPVDGTPQDLRSNASKEQGSA